MKVSEEAGFWEMTNKDAVSAVRPSELDLRSRAMKFSAYSSTVASSSGARVRGAKDMAMRNLQRDAFSVMSSDATENERDF